MPTTICTARSTYSPLDDECRKLYISTSFSFFTLFLNIFSRFTFQNRQSIKCHYEFLLFWDSSFSRSIAFFEVLKHPARPLLIRLYGNSKVRYSPKPIYQCTSLIIQLQFFPHIVAWPSLVHVHMYSPSLPIQHSSLTFPQKGISNRATGGWITQPCMFNRQKNVEQYFSREEWAALHAMGKHQSSVELLLTLFCRLAVIEILYVKRYRQERAYTFQCRGFLVLFLNHLCGWFTASFRRAHLMQRNIFSDESFW
jgi:hypothetical protein